MVLCALQLALIKCIVLQAEEEREDEEQEDEEAGKQRYVVPGISACFLPRLTSLLRSPFCQSPEHFSQSEHQVIFCVKTLNSGHVFLTS